MGWSRLQELPVVFAEQLKNAKKVMLSALFALVSATIFYVLTMSVVAANLFLSQK